MNGRCLLLDDIQKVRIQALTLMIKYFFILRISVEHGGAVLFAAGKIGGAVLIAPFLDAFVCDLHVKLESVSIFPDTKCLIGTTGTGCE